MKTRLIFLCVVSLLAGCSSDASAALTGVWTITVNGVDYKSATQSLTTGCDRAGFQNIRLQFFIPGTQTVVRELSYACPNGGFDTSPIGVLPYGTYDMQWAALDASGNVAKASDRNTPQTRGLIIQAPYIQVPDAAFDIFQPKGNSIAIKASWKVVAAGMTLEEQCTAKAGPGAKVGFKFFPPDDTGLPEDMRGVLVDQVECNSGEMNGFGTYTSAKAIINPGNYLIQGLLFDENGNSVRETSKGSKSVMNDSTSAFDIGSFEF